jgi:hypothetical protein
MKNLHKVTYYEQISRSMNRQQKRAPVMDTLLIAWRRPTLTGGEPPTTIGAEKLNFRVRYGNGCDLLAIVTKLFYSEGLFPQN